MGILPKLDYVTKVTHCDHLNIVYKYFLRSFVPGPSSSSTTFTFVWYNNGSVFTLFSLSCQFLTPLVILSGVAACPAALQNAEIPFYTLVDTLDV